MSGTPEEFIAKIQAKYGGFASPMAVPNSNGTRMPSPGIMPDEMMRFTGNGSDNVTQPSREVPGVPLHEDEMVVEEPLIKKLGGPSKTRAEIEGLVDRKEKGFQEGTGGRTVRDALNSFRKPSVAKEAENSPNPKMGAITRNISKPAVEMEAPAPLASKPPVRETESLPDPNMGAITSNIIPKGPTPVEMEAPPPAPTMDFGLSTPDTNVPPPTPTPPPVQPVLPPTPFEKASATGLKGLQDIAAGESDVARIERNRAETALAGSQSAEDMSQRLNLAQQGASPEVAAAAGARQNRQQRLERAGMQAELATGAAVRAEAAVDRLATLGMEGMFNDRNFAQNEKMVNAQIDNMEQMAEIDWARLDISEEDATLRRESFDNSVKLGWANYGLDEKQINAAIGLNKDQMALQLRKFGLDEKQVEAMIGLNKDQMALQLQQFGLDTKQVESVIAANTASTDLAYKQFEQNVIEHGEEFALRELATEWSINSSLFDAMMQAGNTEAASEFLGEKYDINIDFSQIDDEKKRQQAGNATADLITRVDFMKDSASIDDTEIQNALKSGWEAISDKPFDSTEGQEWAFNTYTATKLNLDPISSSIASYGDEALENMITAAGWGADEFTFAGQTGADAMKLVLTDALGPSAGMISDGEGGMILNPTGALGTFMGGPGGGSNVPGVVDTTGDKESISETLIAGSTPSVDLLKEEAPVMTQSTIPIGEDAVKYSNNATGGYVNFNNVPLKVLHGVDGGGGATTFEDTNGNMITYIKEFDKWIAGDALLLTDRRGNHWWRAIGDDAQAAYDSGKNLSSSDAMSFVDVMKKEG